MLQKPQLPELKHVAALTKPHSGANEESDYALAYNNSRNCLRLH
jgi:hypothetical protein